MVDEIVENNLFAYYPTANVGEHRRLVLKSNHCAVDVACHCQQSIIRNVLYLFNHNE